MHQTDGAACRRLRVLPLSFGGMARDVVAEIRHATRRKFRADEKIWIVLEELEAADNCKKFSVNFGCL